MRKLIAAALLASVLVPAAAYAEAAPAAAAYSTSETSLGALLDNPATKAVLDKYIAAMIANPQIDMARGMTLKALQQFAGEALTDDVLAKIDADLKAIPAKQ